MDQKTGEMKCKHYINLFEYLDDRQRLPVIEEQNTMLCGGMLKNNKGTVSTGLTLIEGWLGEIDEK